MDPEPIKRVGDLHVHSWRSDGKAGPRELIRMAIDRGIYYLGICDHDTMQGAEEAEEIASAKKYEEKIKIWKGLEIDVKHKGCSFHLLGYTPNSKNRELAKTLRVIHKHKKETLDEIIRLLKKNGIDISLKEVSDVASKCAVDNLGKNQIAGAMVKKGIVKIEDEAFKKYLKKGKCAYVPSYTINLFDAFEVFESAKAVAVLPHPLFLEMEYGTKGDSVMRDVLREPMIAGMEVRYPYELVNKTKVMGIAMNKIHRVLRSKYDERLLIKYYDKIATAGSDYHGFSGGPQIGECTIEEKKIDDLEDKRSELY